MMMLFGKTGTTVLGLRTLFASVVIMLAVALKAPSAQAPLMLNGAGATFPYPIYSKWFDE